MSCGVCRPGEGDTLLWCVPSLFLPHCGALARGRHRCVSLAPLVPKDLKCCMMAFRDGGSSLGTEGAFQLAGHLIGSCWTLGVRWSLELSSSSEEAEGLKNVVGSGPSGCSLWSKWMLALVQVDALTCPNYSWMSTS